MERVKLLLMNKKLWAVLLAAILIVACAPIFMPGQQQSKLWTQAGSNHQNTRFVDSPSFSHYVYFTTDEGYLYKLDGETGKEVWKKEGYMWPPFSPTVGSDNVYILKNYWEDSGDTFDGEIYSLDKTTGRKEWSFVTKEGWIMAQPAVDKGYIYTGSMDSSLYCVREQNGEIQWQFNADSSIITSPRLYKDNILFGTVEGYFYCLEKSNGRLIWKSQANRDILEMPAVMEDTVFLSSYNSLFAFSLATGELLWKIDFDNKITAPVIERDNLYIACSSGKVYKIDPKDGKYNIIYNLKGEIPFSPALYNNILYFTAENSLIVAIDATSGKELWKIKDRGNFSPVAVASKVIYTGNDRGTLLAVERESGKILWKFETRDRILTSPAIESKNNRMLHRFFSIQ